MDGLIIFDNVRRILFFITLLTLEIADTDSKLVAPRRLNQEIDLRSGYRHLKLDEAESNEVAEMMLKKNFSILFEFKQLIRTQGTLLSVYSGKTKLLEFQSDGKKGELKAAWRRTTHRTSISNMNIQNIELDDNRWHTFIFEMYGDHLRLVVDCVEQGISGKYPEIDFGTFASQDRAPHVWVSQRYVSEGLLLGKMKQFKVKPESFYKEICRPFAPSSVTEEPFVLTSLTVPVQGVQQDSMNELLRRVEQLESELKQLKSNPNLTDDPHPSLGICPNCYEYLRFKASYLENEISRWQNQTKKLETSLNKVLLHQRGCLVSGNYVDNGYSWLDNCTECICNLGQPLCRPVGCQKLTCRTPYLEPGQCCPICGQDCVYMNRTHEHGATFWPEPCVQCKCFNGDVACSYGRSQCPALNCSVADQVTPENQCCPVCDNEDFCSTRPCHKYATCTRRKHGRLCECNEGFFGDGDEVCFDIDECKWDLAIAKQLGGCSIGSRCINTPGSFQCECLPGYAKIGEHACLDVIIL